MGYASDDFIATVRGGSYNLGVFLYVGTAPPLHLSFTTSDVPMSLDGIDDPSTVYKGAGRFTNLPELEVLINGRADKVTFGLSGVDPVAAAGMLDTAPEVLGALTTIALAPMDQRWQPATDPVRVWTGTADYLAQSMTPASSATRNATQTISLSCYSGDTTRAYPNLQTNTSTTQQQLYPTDNFFNRVARYFQTYVVSWPRF